MVFAISSKRRSAIARSSACTVFTVSPTIQRLTARLAQGGSIAWLSPEGTLKVAAPKPTKLELFQAALAEADGGDAAEATTPKKKAPKKDAADAPAADAAEAPAADEAAQP